MRRPVRRSRYYVVWPLGKAISQIVDLKPCIADLARKTSCHLSHEGLRNQVIQAIVEETLSRQAPPIGRKVNVSPDGLAHVDEARTPGTVERNCNAADVLSAAVRSVHTPAAARAAAACCLALSRIRW